MSSGSGPAERRVTELSIQEALRGYMQQPPLPVAITRGLGHTLVYANSAFCRLARLPIGEAIGATIGSAVAAGAGRACFADSGCVVSRGYCGGKWHDPPPRHLPPRS